HCVTKPELIFRLEHGFGPWSIGETSLWNLPEMKVQLELHRGIKPYECKPCMKTIDLPSQYNKQHEYYS
ncbi:hypothetical protein A6R68_01669, partial [Neotoma lepida]